MTFDQFRKDPRIPRSMWRCGKPRVRAALKKRGLDNEEGYEQIAASIPSYDRNKPDYHDHHMLSTFINQELDEVEWGEMGKPVEKSFEENRTETELYHLIKTGEWRGSENMKPTREEAIERLRDAGGWDDILDKPMVIQGGKR